MVSSPAPAAEKLPFQSYNDLYAEMTAWNSLYLGPDYRDHYMVASKSYDANLDRRYAYRRVLENLAAAGFRAGTDPETDPGDYVTGNIQFWGCSDSDIVFVHQDRADVLAVAAEFHREYIESYELYQEQAYDDLRYEEAEKAWNQLTPTERRALARKHVDLATTSWRKAYEADNGDQLVDALV